MKFMGPKTIALIGLLLLVGPAAEATEDGYAPGSEKDLYGRIVANGYPYVSPDPKITTEFLGYDKNGIGHVRVSRGVPNTPGYEKNFRSDVVFDPNHLNPIQLLEVSPWSKVSTYYKWTRDLADFVLHVKDKDYQGAAEVAIKRSVKEVLSRPLKDAIETQGVPSNFEAIGTKSLEKVVKETAADGAAAGFNRLASLGRKLTEAPTSKSASDVSGVPGSAGSPGVSNNAGSAVRSSGTPAADGTKPVSSPGQAVQPSSQANTSANAPSANTPSTPGTPSPGDTSKAPSAQQPANTNGTSNPSATPSGGTVTNQQTASGTKQLDGSSNPTGTASGSNPANLPPKEPIPAVIPQQRYIGQDLAEGGSGQFHGIPASAFALTPEQRREHYTQQRMTSEEGWIFNPALGKYINPQNPKEMREPYSTACCDKDGRWVPGDAKEAKGDNIYHLEKSKDPNDGRLYNRTNRGGPNGLKVPDSMAGLDPTRTRDLADRAWGGRADNPTAANAGAAGRAAGGGGAKVWDPGYNYIVGGGQVGGTVGYYTYGPDGKPINIHYYSTCTAVCQANAKFLPPGPNSTGQLPSGSPPDAKPFQRDSGSTAASGSGGSGKTAAGGSGGGYNPTGANGGRGSNGSEVSSLGPPIAPARICIGNFCTDGGNPAGATASAPSPGQGPSSNSGSTTSQVNLPGGYFGKATVNSDGTVTVSNNFATVTLSRDQLNKVAAGDLGPVSALMGGTGGAGGNSGKLTGYNSSSSSASRSGSSDISGLSSSGGSRQASVSSGSGIKIDPALLRTKSAAASTPMVSSLGGPVSGNSVKIDVGSAGTANRATSNTSTISGASSSSPLSPSGSRAVSIENKPASSSTSTGTSSTISPASSASSRAISVANKPASSSTITISTPNAAGRVVSSPASNVKGRAASNAASGAANRAASGAASRAASTVASTSASNAAGRAASGAAGRAASNAASSAAGRAASNAAGRAASNAASNAAGRAASNAASRAASNAASRAASNAASNAASRAASNAASRAASNAAANAASNVASRIRIPSDIRFKRDITELGQLSNGLHLYRYRYIGDREYYVGVMAQEVQQVDPGAIGRGADGYLSVDYGRLGLRFMTWDQWTGNMVRKAKLSH